MPAEYGAKGGPLDAVRCGRFIPRRCPEAGVWFRGLTGRNADLLFGRPADDFLTSFRRGGGPSG